ncbi:MAG: gamma-glutamyltransferase [Ferrovum sp. 37-45-19]|uniref:gamma-glutamyltransferase family protein n=1 Tax=Ferrovum sp. JA12 TaxID=1356299 RepID=UPI0007028672|nr:gamma-glutamyltransferase family protein [Ferrovum sp. JA12]OYV79765.1 MAG: gamma-glutamyltransferase [Ferrovum sp. 21-44-67]OYV95387.1 MAG: gamma-glutamyltransferase [Ferrovum sp. 37-45-19]OZB31445.1 MAG: gamma-glutamyltransferase [Ferrovum sp. 34-44-207]HQT81177.1 gamma-glutamyltransferase family protein [Ferrovaceae bacterium]KRH78064.1 putative gamma-glutamyltransferase YwrD [Ferrovum sp. JA12]
MLNTVVGTQGMVTSPHSLASQAGLSILRQGGNAIEAMVAAAATIAVVYPHMNSIGGDGFWVIVPPDGEPIAIRACGGAAQQATIDAYTSQGMSTIPFRGPWAANTVAGTIGGWKTALEISHERGGQLPLSTLLADAIHYALEGIPVTPSQSVLTAKKLTELIDQPGFAETFLTERQSYAVGAKFCQPKLATTLQRLVAEGLDSFYRGPLAEDIARDLALIGSPIILSDLQRYEAPRVTPLYLNSQWGTLYNMTLPTQGAVSLAILGIAERFGWQSIQEESADYVHLLVESTKQAFKLRDRFVTDPDTAPIAAQDILSDEHLSQGAEEIALNKALAWGQGKGPADTVWLGAIDKNGLAVSFIQSIYHEYGSGCVLPTTGINWQNRGASFSLNPQHLLALAPYKKPFHTLNPAAVKLKDGRVMVYGTMGGDGQPQTQAAVFTRHVIYGQPLQQAVTAPRWLLGRTWGQTSDTLKLESRFPKELIEDLKARGHDVELLNEFDETVGHAGAVVRHPNGVFEGASDPRSNGVVASF